MTVKFCKWLFLLLIVSLPLVRPFNTVIFGLLVPYTDFIFILVFFFWLLSLLRGESDLKYTKFYFYTGLYALTLTISTVFSIDPRKSFFKLLGEFYLFALAFVAVNLARDFSFFKKAALVWLAGTGLTILATLAGFALFYIGYKTQSDNYFLSHFGSLPAGDYPRIHALFANANMMCNFLNVSLMMALLAEKTGWLPRFWARTLQIGIWFAAFFTFSPGIGGMILSFGIWHWALFFNGGKKQLSKLVLAATILGAVAVFATTLVSPDTTNTARDFSVPFTEKRVEPSVRVLVWDNSLRAFFENPVVGKGTGTNAAALQYRTLSGANQILLDAHNAWLNVLAQCGVLGLGAFSLLMIYLFRKTRFKLSADTPPNLTHLALSGAFAGAFLYQGLSGSFEDARHLWIMFGLLVGISTFSKSDISEASPAP